MMGPLTQEQRERAEANQGLAWMVANRFHRKTQGEDARQELGAIALLALCQAAQGFDENRGYAFSTYAMMACKQAILDERQSGGPIHTPRYLSHKTNAGHRYRADREHIRDADFSTAPLANLSDPTPSQVEQAKATEIRERVQRLPQRERHIIERMIDGWDSTEIGLEMGITRERVRQLAQVARARLRARGMET